MKGTERFGNPHSNREGIAITDSAVKFGPVDGGKDAASTLFLSGGDATELGDGFDEKDLRVVA